MSAIGTGSSRKSNSVQAVEEALQEARIKVQGFVDWGLVFFSAKHLDHAENIRQILVQNTPGTQWAGCSASGVLSESGEIFGEPGLVILLAQTPEIRTNALTTCQRREHSPSVAHQLREFLEGLQSEEPLSFSSLMPISKLPIILSIPCATQAISRKFLVQVLVMMVLGIAPSNWDRRKSSSMASLG